jgi:hypothetical protein
MNPRLKLACLSVKHADLALPDHTASAKSNFDASILICSHFLTALRFREAFRTTDHQAVIHGVKPELKSRRKGEKMTQPSTQRSPNYPAMIAGQSCAAKKPVNGSRQCPPLSTASILQSKNTKTHFNYAAHISHQEISNHIVTDAAQSSMLGMILRASTVA